MLDHIGKYKFNIHSRKLGTAFVFVRKALKMDFQLLNVLSADVLRNSLHQLGILDSLVHMTVLFLLIGEYMILRMIKSLLHLLFQLCHDLRQCFTALKLPAYCQMKLPWILALHHSIQLISYQQIIAI
mgnify:FL=1